MIRAVLFDFDGVLVESVRIKTEAFRDLFADFPEQVEAIVALHEQEAGRSRFWKFDTIYADILKAPLSLEERARLGERFSALVLEKVLACPLVAGAERFLAEHPQLQLYVVSGTPEEELRQIVEARGLSRFFRGVYGSPRRKGEIIRAVLAEAGLQPSEALMVGDAREDLLGARQAGVFFLGRVPPGEPSPFAACRTVPDLAGLDEMLALYGRMVPVSVAVCTYNGLSKGYLEQALGSIMAQAAVPEELLVVDDGSRDGTADWVRQHYPDFQVVRQPNQGLAEARNTALRSTSCPYLCFLDDDDAWQPAKLQRQHERMAAAPGLAVLYTSLGEIDGRGRALGERKSSPGTGWPEILLANLVLGPSSVMLRRSVAEQVGWFQSGLGGAEDYDFWIRASRFGEVKGLEEPLTLYRVHAGQMSTGYAAMAEKFLEIVQRHSAELSQRWRERVMAYNSYGVLWMGLLGRRRGAAALGWRWARRQPLQLDLLALRFLGMLLKPLPMLQRAFRRWERGRVFS